MRCVRIVRMRVKIQGILDRELSDIPYFFTFLEIYGRIKNNMNVLEVVIWMN